MIQEKRDEKGEIGDTRIEGHERRGRKERT